MTSVVPALNMGSLLGAPESNPEPKTALEKALATVTPEDAAATKVEQVKFQFRDLLDEQQLHDLKANAPAVANKMVGDYNAIISFGEPVLTKLNDSSVQLLNQQRDIQVPEADTIVNGLLREIDGYSARFSSKRLEGAMGAVRKFLRGAAYSLKAMVREAKPIVEKLDIAEVKLREMEVKLANNVSAGQNLHKISNDALEGVVGVLAALEEIVEVARNDFNEVDTLLKDAEAQAGGTGAEQKLVTVKYHGENISLNELRDRHTTLANGISELDKSWFDWRQQFFLNYAYAPSILNIILVSATMQRRCQVFRTMGIPSARQSIVMWQQAKLAQDGAAMGTAVQEGTNRLIQGAFNAAGEAVTEVAMASQTPVISEETVWTVINSIKTQCEGLVAADRWGRAQRAKNLQVLEAGEAGIKQTFTESRRALVQNAVSAVQQPQELAPAPEADILQKIGVTA